MSTQTIVTFAVRHRFRCTNSINYMQCMSRISLNQSPKGFFRGIPLFDRVYLYHVMIFTSNWEKIKKMSSFQKFIINRSRFPYAKWFQRFVYLNFGHLYRATRICHVTIAWLLKSRAVRIFKGRKYIDDTCLTTSAFSCTQAILHRCHNLS